MKGNEMTTNNWEKHCVGLERKIAELETENEKLQSKIVKLESYKQLRNEIYVNDANVLMCLPLTIEVVDKSADRHFRFASDWGLIKDDASWEATRQLIIDKFENWKEG